MALSKSTITGRGALPTDENLQFAELTFALSGLDTEGASVLPGGSASGLCLSTVTFQRGLICGKTQPGLRRTWTSILL